MPFKKLWIAPILTLAAGLVWLAFFWQPTGNDALVRGQALASVPESPVGGDFVLQSPSGPLALSSYRGKVVLIYFGYTYCPDACPTSLARIAQAFSALSGAELAQVGGLFVSLDPERDTMDVLQAYAPFFHPAITGASGSREQLAQLARQYGVRYMKQTSGGDAPYSVDHSSSTYIIARDGKLAATLAHGTSPQVLVDALRAQLSNGG